MKRLIILTILSIFVLNAFIITTYIQKRKNNCNQYILELQEIGYSKKAATHKALVEYKYIPIDYEYISIEED